MNDGVVRVLWCECKAAGTGLFLSATPPAHWSHRANSDRNETKSEGEE